MVWYINDSSLCKQYPTKDLFIADLQLILRLRSENKIVRDHLLCSRNISATYVTSNLTFQETVQGSADRTFTRLALAWITQKGPFWDDSRETNANDLFFHNSKDVTNDGLGEVARRQLTGKEATCFSFANGGFNSSPIPVVQGLLDEPISHLNVDNLWCINALKISANAKIPFPINWDQMLEQAQSRFNKLTILSNCTKPLENEPFKSSVVERVFSLLEVLQKFMDSLTPAGLHTDTTNELISNHFSGSKAWFTDESERNKIDFKSEMTFPDPDKPGKYVFCPWHGKIKTPQYRIHFEWPAKQGQPIRVFYIGPKITKS